MSWHPLHAAEATKPRPGVFAWLRGSAGVLALLPALPVHAPAPTGILGAKRPASHSEQHPARHIQVHGFSHLSCRKDLKCIEGPWERASLTKGKKEKHTEEPPLPMQQALRLLRWKTSTFPSRQSWEQEIYGLGFPALVKHAAAQQRYVGCREMPNFPLPAPEKPPRGCGTHCKAVGRGSTTAEQRLGHRNRESKCL